MPIAKKQPLKQLTIYQSPVRLLVVIFFSVFAAEAFIMFLLAFLQPISIRMWAFLDAILLILLLSPALYFFGFRPLILHITERKQAGEEAQSLKQQMEFILGVTKTGLDIIDSDFNIRFIDTEWQKVYGDPTGRKCYEYFMGRSEVCPGCGIPKALETKTFTVTEEVLVKEGNRPIQVTTLPFQDKEGEWLVAEVNVDITERKRMEEKLLYLSTHDVLTGLYNRTYFDEEMVKLERGRQFPVSLLMVDVDELKTVNDKQGHAAGDELLRRTAQVLGASVRVEDVVARIGGDEFAVLLIGAAVSAAENALMRVRESLEIHNSKIITDFPLSLSLGIATGSKGCSLTKVMQEADAYMYQEKRLRVNKAYRNTS